MMAVGSTVQANKRQRAATSPAPALDTTGVAAIGVEAWHARYAWPVSDAEYTQLAEAVWDAYLDVIEELSGPEQDAVKADLGLPSFLLQHIHLTAAAKRLGQLKNKLPYGHQVEKHLNPDWQVFGNAFSTQTSQVAPFVHGVRAFAKNWYLNGEVPLSARISACLGNADNWALGSRSPMRAAYLAKHGIACRFMTLDDFKRVVSCLNSKVHGALGGALNKMNAAAMRLLDASFDTGAAKKAWLLRLNDLIDLMKGAERLPKPPKKLLINNLGHPVNRALALALHRRGSDVVGFHHGNDLGAQPFPASLLVDLLAVDCFVVPSDACLTWRKNEYLRSRVSQMHGVRFERVQLPLYQQWRAAGLRDQLPQRVEKVMLVGYPPNWIRYSHLAAHWSLAHLHVEIALIKKLNDAGLIVLYKAHPEFELETRELFKNLPCQFVGGSLENCWQLADAFVFPRISSTSFGFAVATNRPIALLDVKGQDWVKDAYDMLARRCHMVPATVDDSLRIHVDHSALIAALRAAPSLPDESYVEAMCA